MLAIQWHYAYSIHPEWGCRTRPWRIEYKWALKEAARVLRRATEVELGRIFLDHLIEEHIHGNDIVKRVSMAKYWLGEMVNRVAYQAVQIHGGYGYMEEYRICRIYRDVMALSIFPGTCEIMKLIISRRLGLSG